MDATEARRLALIGAKVCGYPVVVGAKCPDGTHLHESSSGLHLYRSGEDVELAQSWSPATNIAQAFEVAKAMHQNYHISLHLNADWEYAPTRFECYIQTQSVDSEDYLGQADTLPEAIMRAVEQAAGSEEER